LDGKQYANAEKNWLFLNKKDSTIFCLYYYNPFQILSIDLKTGEGKIYKEFNIPGINLNSHGGACVFLEIDKQYLVLIRNFNNKIFTGNHFLLLNSEYDLLGISPEFFFPDINTNYQMCMSLLLKKDENNNDILCAFVSVNNDSCFIYEYSLTEVKNFILML
jgi:hypothetical protein